MKTCPHCGAAMEDNALFCTSCGTQWSSAGAGAPNGHGNPDQATYYAADYALPYDHTAEFSQQDIHDNKVICLAVYLMGVVGIIIAMLASSDSPFTAFHVRQALKISILGTLTGLAALVLCWTIIVPIAAGIFETVLFVVRIICFVRICQGKAIEAPVVRGFSFMN